MKNATKWMKVMSLVLVLELVVFTAWANQGKGKGQGKPNKPTPQKTPMDMVAWNDCGQDVTFSCPLLSGDTRLCPDVVAEIPPDDGTFHAYFRDCFDDFELNEEILIDTASIGAGIDKKTGLLSIRVWLYDAGMTPYKTDIIPVTKVTYSNGFRYHVCRDYVDVYPHRGKGPAVGQIAIGVIDFFQK